MSTSTSRSGRTLKKSNRILEMEEGERVLESALRQEVVSVPRRSVGTPGSMLGQSTAARPRLPDFQPVGNTFDDEDDEDDDMMEEDEDDFMIGVEGDDDDDDEVDDDDDESIYTEKKHSYHPYQQQQQQQKMSARHIRDDYSEEEDELENQRAPPKRARTGAEYFDPPRVEDTEPAEPSESGDLSDTLQHTPTATRGRGGGRGGRGRMRMLHTSSADGVDLEDVQKYRRLSGYVLYSLSAKKKMLADEESSEDPKAVQRRLQQLWSNMPQKEKNVWKSKAKRMTKQMEVSRRKTEAAAAAAAETSATAIRHGRGRGGGRGRGRGRGAGSALVSGKKSPELEEATRNRARRKVATEIEKLRVSQINVSDTAAYLKLLGDCLIIVGKRLEDHRGTVNVHGSMAVLLDSLVCVLGALCSLTTQVPALHDAVPRDVHCDTLDNISYLIPGVSAGGSK